MKINVMNRIPGKKAKNAVPDKTLQKASEGAEKEGETPSKTIKPENREPLDDKNRKSEARKAFEAEVRGKLKYSKKR